jgi:hypothetical protein
MMNDGTKVYDHARDGAGQESGRCSVRRIVLPPTRLTPFSRATTAERKSQRKPS